MSGWHSPAECAKDQPAAGPDSGPEGICSARHAQPGLKAPRDSAPASAPEPPGPVAAGWGCGRQPFPGSQADFAQIRVRMHKQGPPGSGGKDSRRLPATGQIRTQQSNKARISQHRRKVYSQSPNLGAPGFAQRQIARPHEAPFRVGRQCAVAHEPEAPLRRHTSPPLLFGPASGSPSMASGRAPRACRAISAGDRPTSRVRRASKARARPRRPRMAAQAAGSAA